MERKLVIRVGWAGYREAVETQHTDWLELGQAPISNRTVFVFDTRLSLIHI